MGEGEFGVRYTSYYSDVTFSILDRVLGDVSRKWGFSFKHNGLKYSVGSRIFQADVKCGGYIDDGWGLFCIGPVHEYVMPWSEGDFGKPLLTSFDRGDFEKIIDIFEIEGKTVRWILEHQKEWKYKLPASHLEKILPGWGFEFVYRGIVCFMFYRSHEGRVPLKERDRGFFLEVSVGFQFDVSQCAPCVPGAEHWFDVVFRESEYPDCKNCVNACKIERKQECNNEPCPVCPISYMWLGPYLTVGKLLDGVNFGGKTLREIFDTEYDDGKVLCGMFTG